MGGGRSPGCFSLSSSVLDHVSDSDPLTRGVPVFGKRSFHWNQADHFFSLACA